MILVIDSFLAKRYDAIPGTCYLFRPDQHVCARWRSFDLTAVRAAIARATANADDGSRIATPSAAALQKEDTKTVTKLNTDPNLSVPDDFYDQLIGMHRGLTDAQSAHANARLILLLANHIGDAAVLHAAMAAAREDIAPRGGV